MLPNAPQQGADASDDEATDDLEQGIDLIQVGLYLCSCADLDIRHNTCLATASGTPILPVHVSPAAGRCTPVHTHQRTSSIALVPAWTKPVRCDPGCMQIGPGQEPQLPEATGRTPCGRVVGIIRRNWRTRGYAGSLQVVLCSPLHNHSMHLRDVVHAACRRCV